jgi:acetyl-CoA/propionyl-CoA carboxylase biotin carboxyl carrier protein
VRLDAGTETGTVIGPAWDSLLGKLIVTGATRQQALQRAARALAEFEVDGLATALPFHRTVVADPAFAPVPASEPFTVHTRWIETEFANEIPPFAGAAGDDSEAEPRQTVVVEVGGKRLEVSLPASFAAVAGAGPAAGAGASAPRRRAARKSGGSAASGDSLAAPMQGTVVKVAVSEGDQVAAGDLVLVLEAMKMEQPINAHKGGTVKGLKAAAGDALTSGTVICEITD